MATHGWAVMDNMTSLFHPDCRPSEAQRHFIHTLPENLKEHIFEGVTRDDTSPVFTPSKDKLGAQARKQMVSKLPPVKYSEYIAKYERQATCIIEGYRCVRTETPTTPVQPMLVVPPMSTIETSEKQGKPCKSRRNESTTDDSDVEAVPATHPPASDEKYEEHKGMFNGPAGCASNWTIGTTTVIGGINYQHPHSDCGVAESYNKLKIFPFVCLHGFGVDPYSLWILPDAMNSKYGFLHMFRPDQIIFLRGDFVHAGVPSKVPRGHFKFFPHPAAGWSRLKPYVVLICDEIASYLYRNVMQYVTASMCRSNTYWNRVVVPDATFLWQHPSIPFGFPDIGTPTTTGEHLITYPPIVTSLLRLPWNRKQCEVLQIPYKAPTTKERQERARMKKRIQAQIALGVLNY